MDGIATEADDGRESPLRADRPVAVQESIPLVVEPHLSATEERLLQQCELRIERGMRTFIEVGMALCSIKNQRLYRQTHPTFDSYCQDRWRISRFYAYRLIGAANVACLLADASSLTPTTEAQVRPLSGLDPQIIPTLWKEAVARASGGPITGKLVKSVVLDHAATRNAEGHGRGLRRNRCSQNRDVSQLLQRFYKAKLLVERGYTDDALRALDAVEIWLASLPGRCADCYLSGDGQDRGVTQDVGMAPASTPTIHENGRH